MKKESSKRTGNREAMRKVILSNLFSEKEAKDLKLVDDKQKFIRLFGP